jgi:hypothetical protein
VVADSWADDMVQSEQVERRHLGVLVVDIAEVVQVVAQTPWKEDCRGPKPVGRLIDHES